MAIAHLDHDVLLRPGGFYFGAEERRVRTMLGSCVAIVLWNPDKRVGGMCHYMLPTRGKASSVLDGRYGDEAMALFLAAMRKQGTPSETYQAKLFGGACLLAEQGTVGDVGSRNVAAGRELLERHGFSIIAEQTGGRHHLNLIFEMATGDVWVRNGARGQALAATRSPFDWAARAAKA